MSDPRKKVRTCSLCARGTGEAEAEAMEAEEDEWVARMLEDDVLVAQMLMQLMNGKPSSSPPLTSPALRWGRLGKRRSPSTPRLHGWFDGGAINEGAPKPASPLTLVEAGRHDGSPLSPLEWNTSPGRNAGEGEDSPNSQNSRKVDQAGDEAPSTSSSRANGEPSVSVVKSKPPAPEELKVVAIPLSEVAAYPSVTPEIESPAQPGVLAPTAASLLTNVAENLTESLPSDHVHENAATAETSCGTSLPDCSRSAILPDLNLPHADWF